MVRKCQSLEKYDGQVVRWVMNATHYRAPINFTDEIFNTAESELNKINNSLKQASLILNMHNAFNDEVDENYIDKYLNYLADDLNISDALSVLYETLKILNQAIRNKEQVLTDIAKLFNTINYMLDLIGIKKYEKKLSEDEKKSYKLWLNAKANKDFAKADEIRKELIDKGIL